MILLNDFKIYLKIDTSNTTNDGFLQSCIDTAVGQIESYCNRRFTNSTYTEYLNGNGCNEIYLRHFPVTKITEIKSLEYDTYVNLLVSPDTIDNSTEIISDYNILKLTKGYIFPTSSLNRNIKIEYEAGFAIDWNDVPYELKSACKDLAANEFLKSKVGEGRLGLSGSNLNSGVSDGKTYVDIDVSKILNKYRIKNI